MGDIRRKHKQYRRPMKPFEKTRINEENALLKRYGLKNKREIWKAEMAVKKMRNHAKDLITAEQEEKDEFIDRLQKQGFKAATIEDVLALNREDWLKRRLQSVLYEKELASTVKEARQLITHKHVLIGDKKVNIPSYLVSLDEENKISVALKPKPVAKEKKNGETKASEENKERKEGTEEKQDINENNQGVKNG